MLTFFSSFFGKNKYAVIATAVAVILFFLFLNQRKQLARYEKKIAVAAHNLAAANDTIRLTKAKNGQIEADKLSYLFQNIDDLKKANVALYNEIKITQGKVQQIQKADIQIVHDTVPLVVKAELVDSTITTPFSFDTTYSPGNFRSIGGYTKYDFKSGIASGKLTTDKIGVSIVTGIKNLDKGKPEIFIRSTHPGLEVINVEGAIIDKNLFSSKPKSSLVTVGVTVGWVPLTYDFQDKKTEFKLQRIGVTAGASFNLVRLLTKK